MSMIDTCDEQTTEIERRLMCSALEDVSDKSERRQPYNLSRDEDDWTEDTGSNTEKSSDGHPLVLTGNTSSLFKKHFKKRQKWWIPGWTEIENHYMMSIKQKYIQHKDQRFPSGEELLADVYTEPVIIQKSANGGFNNVCVDEFFRSRMHNQTVILQGCSGMGKSSIAQKIMLDWASGKCYLNFDLVFYLRCEELMCISEEMSLIELLSWSCSLTSDLISQMLKDSSCKVLLLIDGYDEFRLLDSVRRAPPDDVLDSFQRAPPELIVCALLRGQILSEHSLLVTTKTEVPQGTLLKRPQCFTKIMGFSENKIKQYFEKFFQNGELFRKAFESVKANETLFTACSIPVICWIICTVIRERFNDGADITSGLETTTSIYVDFVSTLLEHHCQGLSESVPTLLKSLGQLAERGMLEQQVLFDEKSVNETVSDPVGSPFLGKFLLKKKIRQDTMFSFIHLSFQEFFTALYYVLLDEEVSQKKVRELLHSVESGWALSCLSVEEFSNRDSEIRSLKHLQSVILFLYGLCRNEMINSFFEKHNVAVSVKLKTQVKEWIHQCLHQCCNLRLSVTSDNLKILQPALCSCEELWLMLDHISDDVGEFISAVDERKIRDRLIFGDSVKGVLTLLNVLQSVSNLKKVHLQLDRWTDKWVSTIISLTQTCPRLNELGINTTFSFIPSAVTQSLKEPLRQRGWTLTVRTNSVLIKLERRSLSEELKTGKRANSESKSKPHTLQAVDTHSGQWATIHCSTQAEIRGAELFSTGKSSVEDAEVFTPENIDRDDESKGTNTHRFMSPHAAQFQCSLTNLVFVMEGKGEMLYKIVPWDPRLLDGLGQMQPAGPLYNIDCFEGSISQLHLPHCEILSEENKDSFAVAHFTGDNVEMLQPLKVTDTHVIIGITELSPFGLLKKIIFPASPVRSQVLLFVRPFSVKQREKILDVHLLPSNVPVSEVRSQHKENMYIETTATCDLIPGREYSLCCQPEGFEVQPQGQVFECNFGPNYHPTFEVFLDVSNEEVRLWVLDRKYKAEVWTRRRIILIAPSPNTDTADLRRITEFVDRHRDVLIERVTSGMAVADSLKSKGMINPESYRTVRAAETDNKKMRLLFDVLDSGGSAVKAEFYRLLKDKEPFLLRDLETPL